MASGKEEMMEIANEYIKIVSSAKSSCNDAAKSISALRLQLSESWKGASGDAMEQALAAVQAEILAVYTNLNGVESDMTSRANKIYNSWSAATVSTATASDIAGGGGFGGSGGRDSSMYEKIFNEQERKVLEDTFKEVYGKDVYHGVKVYNDISTGNVSWDTLENTMKAVGVKSTNVDVIVTTCKTVTNPTGNMKRLTDYKNQYMNSAAKRVVNGDIAGGLADLGKSTALGLVSIGYGAFEVASEVGANVISKITKKVSSALKVAGKYVPGAGGKILKTAGNAISTVSDKVTGWIRKLF